MTPRVSDFKRFDMEATSRCGETFDELTERPDGEWMLFNDHAAAMNLARAEIATLREQLAKVCEVGKDLRDTEFCDVIVALDCPRGDCDCCTCDAAGKFDAAIAAARKVVGEGKP